MQFSGIAAVVFAVLLLDERLTFRHVWSGLVLLLGSLLIVVQPAPAFGWTTINPSDLLVLIGAVGLGFAYIPAKNLAQQLTALQVSTLRLLIGGATLIPLVLARLGTHSIRITPTVVWALPLLVIVNYCLPYITLQAGLRRLRAWETAAVMQTVPVFSTFFAVVLLHDSLTSLQRSDHCHALC